MKERINDTKIDIQRMDIDELAMLRQYIVERIERGQSELAVVDAEIEGRFSPENLVDEPLGY